MIPRTGRFGRSDRIRASRDFRRVSREGKRAPGRYFVVLTAPAWQAPSSQTDLETASPAQPVRRLGLTVSRRVGNAVVRNRVKRAVREWFRLWRWELPDGIDMVVIARPQAAQLSSQQISEALCRQLELTGPALGSERPEPSPVPK